MEQATLIQAKAPAAFVSFCGYDEERCLGTIIYVSCGYTRKLCPGTCKVETGKTAFYTWNRIKNRKNAWVNSFCELIKEKKRKFFKQTLVDHWRVVTFPRVDYESIIGENWEAELWKMQWRKCAQWRRLINSLTEFARGLLIPPQINDSSEGLIRVKPPYNKPL